MLRSYAPATGALLGEVPVATREDVRRAVARARRAQEAWALLPIAERAERILRYRNAFVDRAEEIVDLEVRETGKTRHEALIFEVFVVADVATYLTQRTPRSSSPRRGSRWGMPSTAAPTCTTSRAGSSPSSAPGISPSS